MELSNELINKIKKEYYEWCDDCKDNGLPIFSNPKEVFEFIEHYCKPSTNLDKLIRVVNENDAKYLLKLYTTLINYINYLIRKGYNENFKDLCNSLINSINNIMEV